MIMILDDFHRVKFQDRKQQKNVREDDET